MKSIKCPQCGLVQFANETSCKRCNGSLISDNGSIESDNTGARFGEAAETAIPYGALAPQSRPVKSGMRRMPLRKILVFSAGFAVLAFVIVTRVVPWKQMAGLFNGSSDYSQAIKESMRFKSPVWVRANREESPLKKSTSPTGGGSSFVNVGMVVDEVSVLQALGLLNVERYEVEVSGPPQGFMRTTLTTRHYRISLTARGQMEAALWEVVDERLHPAIEDEPTTSWWHVPIGAREFEEVTRVGEIRKEAGKETVEVEFSYLWKPNEVGDALDRGNARRDSVPPDALRAAQNLPWDSRKAHFAIAQLERVGPSWKVSEIRFMSEDGVRSSLTYW